MWQHLDIVHADAPSGAIIYAFFTNVQFSFPFGPRSFNPPNSFYTPTHCSGERLHLPIASIHPFFSLRFHFSSSSSLSSLCLLYFMDKGWGLTLDTSSSQSLPLFPSNDNKMFPLLGFPVNLSRASKEDDENRKVVGEVDFFSDRNKPTPPPSHDHNVKPNIVKKEIDETPLHINVTSLTAFHCIYYHQLFVLVLY